MQSPHEEGEAIFFDSLDYVRKSSDSASSDDLIENSEFRLGKHMYEIWTDEPKSISERRERFLHGMRLQEDSPSLCCNHEIREASCCQSEEPLGLERITEHSGAVSDRLSSSVDGCDWDLDCCIRDLDSGKKFLVQELGQDGPPCYLREAGSDRLLTLDEFENYLGISHSILKLMCREEDISQENGDCTLSKSTQKSRSWWRGFAIRSATKNCKVRGTVRMRVQHNKKRCMEFTAVYLGQEIQGHTGPIWTMKFSPDGRYLATGGEDCVLRIWSIEEVDGSCKSLPANGSSMCMDGFKADKLVERHFSRSASIVIPKRIFKLADKPTHEFLGHTNGILDLTWSKSNCLLTASKDKTARIWQVGRDECLQVFQHNNYVTCIQFDPLDDEYFISGSIDGKVRIWGIRESHVIEWIEVRDIVTAISYQPNGQGFVVGTIGGSCRFYDSSGNNLQLVKQLFFRGKKKSTGKRITGFQFAPDDPGKVMVTSADSKVRIVDGVDVIQKYRGPGKSKRQLSASFTEDGRHIVSVGDDSHIHVWNYGGLCHASSKNLKSIRSCEHFFSESVSIAVPWPGIEPMLGGVSSIKNSQTHKKVETSILKDLDRLLAGGWFFTENHPRVSVSTWPEEKLSMWSETSNGLNPNSHQNQNMHPYGQGDTLSSASTSWSRVIVAAGSNGAIRTFHNYGLPVRL